MRKLWKALLGRFKTESQSILIKTYKNDNTLVVKRLINGYGVEIVEIFKDIHALIINTQVHGMSLG